MAEFNFDNLSPEEKEQLAREAFKSKEKEFAKRAKEEQEAHYKQLVDETIEKAVESVGELHIKMTIAKKQIFNDFDTVIALKNELYTGQKWLKTDRVTNTFTNQEGNKRVTVGYHTNDNYLDTYTEGVKLVEEYISSLATDENGQKLADMVKVLLSERGKGGQLKAQNVLRLQRMANDSKNETFIEGMRIISDAYSPTKSKQFVKVEIKGEHNEWVTVSTNMTDCEW
ncbi:MAG: DUF3164 family protein [Paludibacteraceae bacterium]|nr:DUF3164 family protein [Paludibacteraceae bacterium]